MEETKKKSSLRNKNGVADVLNEVEKECFAQLSQWLEGRMKSGQSNLSQEEIETICRFNASLTRRLCANAVGEAFQIGVNSSVPPEDHVRETKPPK